MNKQKAVRIIALVLAFLVRALSGIPEALLYLAKGIITIVEYIWWSWIVSTAKVVKAIAILLGRFLIWVVKALIKLLLVLLAIGSLLSLLTFGTGTVAKVLDYPKVNEWIESYIDKGLELIGIESTPTPEAPVITGETTPVAAVPAEPITQSAGSTPPLAAPTTVAITGTVQAGRIPSLLPEPYWVSGVSEGHVIKDLQPGEVVTATGRARPNWVKIEGGYVWSPWIDWSGDLESLPQISDLPPSP